MELLVRSIERTIYNITLIIKNLKERAQSAKGKRKWMLDRF